MDQSAGTRYVGELTNVEAWPGKPMAPLPVPAVAPDGFEVRLWEGFGGFDT